MFGILSVNKSRSTPPQTPSSQMSATDTTARLLLRIDEPLKGQQAELGPEGRKKLMESRCEIEEMKLEWKGILRRKLEEMHTQTDEKKGANSKRVRSSSAAFSPWKFNPDSFQSVYEMKEDWLQCIKAIREEAKASGEILPWRECFPSGILSCKPLNDYIKEWIAEEP
jgi:hypothetical protein